MTDIGRDASGDVLDELIWRASVEQTTDEAALRDLVAIIDGAVISALIEADPDPRAVARAVLVRSLRGTS